MTELDFEQGNILGATRENSDQLATLETDLPFQWSNHFYGANKTGDACPDCGVGMVRLGSCFSCQSCGYESCYGG